ncbi:Hypothetical protein KVN_LOCUS434 [uncultured virus]|nr:Hypothetical protein KVN_LOCUS434 [uncultured virus]
MSNNKTNEVFWLDDISQLYSNNKIIKIIPTKQMTKEEQLNTLTRFLIILFLIIFLIDNNSNYLIFPFLGIIILIVFYYIYKSDKLCKKNINNKKQIKNNFSPKIQKNNYLIDTEKSIASENTFDFLNHITESNNENSESVHLLNNYENETNDKNYFNTELYLDYDNLYDKKTYERNFDPNSINDNSPDNQMIFAKWLYGNTNNTKEKAICSDYS